MTTSSAPGKVYLFGEHAVVYGEPAIACAIERRATVTATARSDGRLRVEATDLTIDGFAVEYGGDLDDAGSVDVDVPRELVAAATGYVEGAIAQARDAADAPDAGFAVEIESDLPLGGGLSSSAAVVVAAIDATTRELGVELSDRDLAERAYRVERDVQAGGASRTDTFCSAMGGAVRVEGEDRRRIEAPELPLVVGYDGGAGNTGELVAGVGALREKYGFATDTVAAIGDLVRRGEGALEDGALDEVGRLMDVDHGLLSALGVSARSLDAMVWAAREGGARGAKLTGAGGGGCVVALEGRRAATAGEARAVANGDGGGSGTLDALRYAPECEQAFRAGLDSEGVRVEGP
ncbi:mevalonate kinase [Halobacteriales archaeon QS_4_69_34]|nr:MAG: mevalonate kinase [Halobacteriales archaeon QS_4_69_34]